MRVNRDQFLAEGYVILRHCIPPEMLDAVRTACEKMVDRQRAIWAPQRTLDAPAGGVWETAAQPRLHLQTMGNQVDAETALAVEIWLHENLQGVSSELLGLEDAAVTETMMMCNPVRDHGPAKWHRDFYPPYCAPLQSYADDILENGPRYVQWNIPLYDDNVLWVVPQSHIRRNTEEEIAKSPKTLARRLPTESKPTSTPATAWPTSCRSYTGAATTAPSCAAPSTAALPISPTTRTLATSSISRRQPQTASPTGTNTAKQK